MRNITISISEDNFEAIRQQIDNKSRLIDNLLRDHFKNMRGESKEFIESQLKEAREQQAVWNEKMVSLSAEERNEALRQQEILKEKKEIYEAWKKSDERWAKMRPLQEFAFKCYTNPENIDFSVYFDELKQEKVLNLLEFATKHNMVLKDGVSNSL